MQDEITPTVASGADRRAFLLRAGLGTAAVAGVAAATPSFASTDASGVSSLDLARADAQAAPVTAYVKNAARGEIAVLVGKTEVVYTDRDAVARLLAAVGR